MDEIAGLFGGVDILVNNAGGSETPGGGFGVLTDEHWMDTINTNLMAPVRLDRGLIPFMIQHKSGVIIHIGGNIAFMHSVVPQSFKGKGIGSALARFALDFANTENLKIMLYCPFVCKFVKEHEEYHRLVDVDYHPWFKKLKLLILK